MSYDGSRPVGGGGPTDVPVTGSLDTVPKKKGVSSKGRNIKVKDDVVPQVGNKGTPPVIDSSRPVPQTKLTSRDVVPNGHLDPVGLGESGSLGVDDEDLDTLLDEQLEQHRTPEDQPRPTLGSGDDLPPPPPSDEDEPPGNPKKTGNKPKVQISSTTEVPDQENLDGIKKGLKSRFAFLDKIPHKKDILCIAIGAVICAAALGAMPATLGLIGLGSALVLTGTAYMLHDAGTPKTDAPPPPPPPHDKPKNEDEEEKKEKPGDHPPPPPGATGDNFLAVANPDFQEAEQSASTEDARRKLQELLQQKPPYSPEKLEDLVTTFASADLPLSHAVSEVMGQVLYEAGMNHQDNEAWAQLDKMIGAVKGAVGDESSGAENAGKMKEACLSLLAALRDIKPETLVTMRAQTVALLSSGTLNAAAKQVLKAQLEAIDLKLAAMKQSASTPLSVSSTGVGATALKPEEKLGLKPEVLDEGMPRRRYLNFRMELSEQMDKGGIRLSEFEADRILFAAMGVLKAGDAGSLSGPEFIKRLKQDASMASFAATIDRIARGNRIFSGGGTPS